MASSDMADVIKSPFVNLGHTFKILPTRANAPLKAEVAPATTKPIQLYIILSDCSLNFSRESSVSGLFNLLFFAKIPDVCFLVLLH